MKNHYLSLAYESEAWFYQKRYLAYPLYEVVHDRLWECLWLERDPLVDVQSASLCNVTQFRPPFRSGFWGKY